MSQDEVLAVVLDALERLGVRYMVAGSFASNLHGVPRMTQDADVVVDLDEPSALALVKALAAEFYVSESAAREAVAHQRMFNAIHLEAGFKVDLVVKKRRPFSDEELRRRIPGSLGGRVAYFASPEDTVLTKLEWALLGDSERQYVDAVAILRLQVDRLDAPYLDRWAAALGVAGLLARARQGHPFRARTAAGD